ncbi:MAG: tetratricopeptide repeat protein [Gemmatimonadetes bacterium]|nr:tetratricopeptide repeat protein [Gemmatimonadota bacterium]
MILRLGIIFVMLLSAETSSAQERFESSDPMVVISDDSIAVILDPALKSAVDSLETGKPGGAAVALRDILEKNSAHTQALRLLVSAYLRMEDFDRAIDACQLLAVQDSTDASALVALGYLYQRIGDIILSEQYYQQGLALDPDIIAAYQGLGWIYLKTGQLERALDMASETTERMPHYALNYILMGRALTAQGFFEDAAIAYNRAFALQNDLREQYGILLQELGLRHRLKR